MKRFILLKQAHCYLQDLKNTKGMNITLWLKE